MFLKRIINISTTFKVHVKRFKELILVKLDLIVLNNTFKCVFKSANKVKNA